MVNYLNHYYFSGLQKNLSGQYPEAVADYTKAIGIDSSHIDAYLKRGVLRYKILKQYEESLSDFNKAIELNPHCSAAYLHRGIVKCHLLRFSEALPDLDRAVELDPNDERAFLNRGKLKYMLKHDKSAVCTDLEKAILLHSPQAADMIKLFYGEGMESMQEYLNTTVKEKLKNKKN